MCGLIHTCVGVFIYILQTKNAENDRHTQSIQMYLQYGINHYNVCFCFIMGKIYIHSSDICLFGTNVTLVNICNFVITLPKKMTSFCRYDQIFLIIQDVCVNSKTLIISFSIISV